MDGVDPIQSSGSSDDNGPNVSASSVPTKSVPLSKRRTLTPKAWEKTKAREASFTKMMSETKVRKK